MLPPLKSQILKWGLLAQWLYWAKYLQAILACPAILLPGHGRIFLLIQLSGYPQFMLSTSSLPLHGCWSLHYDLCPSHFHTHSDTLFRIISALSLSFHIYSIFSLEGKSLLLHFDLFWNTAIPCIAYLFQVSLQYCNLVQLLGFPQLYPSYSRLAKYFRMVPYWQSLISSEVLLLVPCVFCLISGYIPFLQQSATGTFISIDKFTKFCSRLRTEHYMHMINVMVLLYHRPYYRTSVLFVFMQFISNL